MQILTAKWSLDLQNPEQLGALRQNQDVLLYSTSVPKQTKSTLIAVRINSQASYSNLKKKNTEPSPGGQHQLPASGVGVTQSGMGNCFG